MHETHGITHQNPNTMALYHLHELLLSLLLPVPPENSLTHVFWPVLHSSQLLTPHNRESRAPGTCTSLSIHAQSTPHSHRCSTYSYLHPCRRRHLVTFRSSSSRPSVLSAVTLPQLKQLPSKRLRDLLYFSPRSAIVMLPDADNIFESCCCLRSLLYWFPTTCSLSAFARPVALFLIFLALIL